MTCKFLRLMSLSLKTELRTLLEQRDFERLHRWSQERRRAFSAIFSLTYDSDELVIWRAIEASGVAAHARHVSNIEQIRDFIRRLTWLMNDESGGLGWRAPEVIGEILANVPRLIPEYAPLIPHYFEEEPFERGSVYAVGRIGTVAPEVIRENRSALLKKTCDSDPFIRAHALRALRAGGFDTADIDLDRFTAGSPWIRLYQFETGTLHHLPISAVLRDEVPLKPPAWHGQLSRIGRPPVSPVEH